MLGRCRMRRGVSLEVIVEEDDNAEVSFDPVPLIEEPDDQYEDSETGTGSSARSTPRDHDDDDDDDEDRDSEEREEGITSAEERRRKRDRRRTVGGLSRFRSVSCEALTLLDTSDMESCCSEWDDNDDLATSSNGNYVTLNKPISRRRIIQNIHSQCDSEDSGFEYHSNEDDHVLEDHSSNEDQADDEHDEGEEREESEEAEARARQEREAVMQLKYHPDDREDDETTIATRSDDEGSTRIQMNEQQQTADSDIQPRSNEGLSEGQSWQQNPARSTPVPTSKFSYSPNEALENDKIIIVETTNSVPLKTQQSTADAAEEEMQLKREAYTIRNKEVRLAELPRPDTVKSVKQLFENLNTPVQHFHTWRDLGRFRDIKSNPSSKILRFDRNDGNESLASYNQFSSLTLPRLPSQTGFTNTHTTARTVTTNGMKDTEKNKNITRKTSENHSKTPISNILTQFMAAQHGTKGECQDKVKHKHNNPARLVKTQSGEKVILRKPIVKGFNVKRALMENPRNFLPYDRTTTSQKQQQKSNHNDAHRLTHFHRSHHHREMADKSDTESLASDISEDSGVSNDSLASTSSSTPLSYRAFDAYASDPSFKWIDPSVMAKIRAVGTTVIFFGPRQRPKQEGTLPRGTTSISSGLRINKCSQASQGGHNLLRSSQATRASANRQEEKPIPIPAPRIVGVVRKQSSSNNSPDTSQASIQETAVVTPPTTETHFDSTPSSPPTGRYEAETTAGKKGRWRAESDTVVYNFTKPQPPAVYF
ncbi:uncharacterized protein LOC135221641 [Macrobrachium nipponense]|uniref:uncharacterized protein LOC135221641 n=1 Tax=Macrobrachium nipponense TaxID=159736 RepID=UPI0030C7EAAF